MGVLLKVLEFSNKFLVSRCKVVFSENPDFYVGQLMRVDLTASGDFGETPESLLVGKVIKVQRLLPCEFIGIGCSIKENTKGDADE